MSDPLALAELHLDILYERDDAGLLVRPRSAGVATPSFHLVRTALGNRWLLSAALPEERRAELERDFSNEPVPGALEVVEGTPPAGMTAGAYRGPAFRFPEPLPPAPGVAELLVDPRDVPTVPELAWIRDATPAERPLAVARNDAGEIVSVCHSARSTAGGAEAGVETAPAYRGRGLAGAVVLAWAAAVLAEGRLPLYSTQWTNHASRAVARKLGLVQYGEDYHD